MSGMSENVITHTLRVADMTCVNCERRIETELKEMPGVNDVKASFSDGGVRVTYDADITDTGTIEKIIEELGYRIAKGEKQRGIFDNILRFVGIVSVLCGLYVILDRLELLNIFYDFPEAKVGMGYGMIFMVGLFTSVHCIGMCGGINLSLSMSGSKPSSSISRDLPKYPGENAVRLAVLRAGFLYNLGRIVSYTLIGGFVGMLGAAVSPTRNVSGAIQLVAGIFMIIMGLNMLNVFPWLRRFSIHMPKSFTEKIRAGWKKGPFYVGILNGFMPCGPLQAMQLYALSTGSFVRGALSMFMFSAGTMPLMFGLSALSSILSKKFTRGIMTAGAALVILMGVAMFGNGINTTGLSQDLNIAQNSQRNGAGVNTQSTSDQIQNTVQLVRTELHPRRYDPITVQVGVPVRWTIHAAPGTLNGCNNRFTIPEYDSLQKRLSPGDNIVEFTPTRTGTFTYSCWMGMIHGKITVVEGDAGNTTVAACALSPIPNEGMAETPRAGVTLDTFIFLPRADDSCCSSDGVFSVFSCCGNGGIRTLVVEEDGEPYGAASASLPSNKRKQNYLEALTEQKNEYKVEILSPEVTSANITPK
jgi:sulfite exporter TauE/SafE/copper chaperone CopZ